MGASWVLPGSPLFCDWSWVASPGEQAGFRPFAFLVVPKRMSKSLQNVVQNGVQMERQMHKMWHDRATNHEKTTSRKHAHYNHTHNRTTGPHKLDFRFHSYTESQFPLFKICSECEQNGSRRPLKLRPAGAYGVKRLAKETFERCVKTSLGKDKKCHRIQAPK